jgi:FMN phosphatase YigB (HAD superfamily)
MRWGAEACVFKPIEDFNELTGHVDEAFKKIDHWWAALKELKALKEHAAIA